MKGKIPLNSEKIKCSPNLFVDKTKSIVTFKISKFISSLKDSWPYSRIRVTTDCWLIYCISDFINIVLIVQHEKGAVEKMRCSFYIEATTTKKIQSILETVLKLMLSKMA